MSQIGIADSMVTIDLTWAARTSLCKSSLLDIPISLIRGGCCISLIIGHVFWKACQSMPNCRTVERTVPSFKSRPPQSGTTTARSVSGLNHFR